MARFDSPVFLTPESLEQAGSFFKKYWYILVLIVLSFLILSGTLIYLKWWKKKASSQPKLNITTSTVETLATSKPGSELRFLSPFDQGGNKMFFKKKVNNFAMLGSRMHVSSVVYRE